MTIVTFYAPARYAVHVQNLVKRYGGYFVHNPIGIGIIKNALFEISFEDTVSVEDYRAFSIRTHILTQPWA